MRKEWTRGHSTSYSSSTQTFLHGAVFQTGQQEVGKQSLESFCSLQAIQAGARFRMPQNNTLKGNRANSELGVEERLRSKAAESLASQQWSPGPLGRALSPGSRLEVGASGDQAELFQLDETKLYHRRWVMLFLFSAVSANNAVMWLQYGIISNIFMRFYNVDALAIDWLSMVYLFTYVPLILPVLWLLENRGIRDVVLVGSAFNCIGTWIKIASASPNMFLLTFFGQFVCSVATVFLLGIPSHLASVWFGENEVSTACSIGVLGNQVSLKKKKQNK
ncbi:choline/ethanolamine transporter flvcr2b-like [Fundulus diaphanus]